MRDTQRQPLRTVWILVAGFSRWLGGPLLRDRFRQEHFADLKARYPATYGDLAEHCWKTQVLFNHGKSVENQWFDAEQFIDFVDSTAPGSPTEQLLMRMTTSALGTREEIKPVPRGFV